MQVAQPLQLGFVHCHDEFPANLMRNAVLPAEGNHLLDAGDGHPRLDGSGFVIKTAMKHTAVVAGLVAPDLRLFLENRNLRIGNARRKFVRRRQTDYPATDDDDTSSAHSWIA